MKPSIKCICPRCKKEHRLKLNWKGRGVPRKYCTTCKGVVERSSGAVEVMKRIRTPHKEES